MNDVDTRRAIGYFMALIGRIRAAPTEGMAREEATREFYTIVDLLDYEIKKTLLDALDDAAEKVVPIPGLGPWFTLDQVKRLMKGEL